MNNELVCKILEMYRNGLTTLSIHRELKKIYPLLTRVVVRDIVRSSGLMRASESHGGYRAGSGRGTKYIYNGDVFDSYSELCYKLTHPTHIKVYKHSFPVDGVDNKYFPDFYDESTNTYIEIKDTGYSGWGRQKLNSNKQVIVILKQQCDEIIQEAEKLFGNDIKERYKKRI